MVAKAHPEERVGVFARRDGRIEVVEYSELDPAEASLREGALSAFHATWEAEGIAMHCSAVVQEPS